MCVCVHGTVGEIHRGVEAGVFEDGIKEKAERHCG